MKKIILTLFVLLLVNCSKEGKINLEQPSRIKTSSVILPVEKTAVENPKLETFGFPKEVEGCSCYFAKNKEDFDAEKYVYIDDYGKNAYLKSEGKMIKIPMKDADFHPEKFSKTVENKELSVKIEGKKIKDLEEVMMFEGTMTVDYKNGEQITTPVYGECGC